MRPIRPILAALLLAPGLATTAELDQRTVIQLDEAGRHFVLSEMRQYVKVLQQITGALAREDMATVADSAQSMGRQVMKNAPPGMMQSMPAGFRQLGMSVHMDFERIALDAGSLGDASHTLGQLSDVLGKCVACHEGFRIESW